MVERDRQVVQILDERTRFVQNNFITFTPGKSLNTLQINGPILFQRRAITAVLFENGCNFRWTLIDFALQVIEQVSDSQIRFPNQTEIQARIRSHGFTRNRCDMSAKSDGYGTPLFSKKNPVHIIL